MGQLLHLSYFESLSPLGELPGTYALLGGAAMLAGVTRMTISITVILCETTNNSTYLLPIMLVVMVSKMTGDLVNEGLYDIYIELGKMQFLAHFSPLEKKRSIPAIDRVWSPCHYGS